ncbi:NIPSNAP family protein [Akkermansiaceae bacterium]|nr:NIPSNAP family protein [bacterium]MDB0056148.1 NIPSNAP family protein [Akkermansiaceae bacterium]MDB4041040.1 NIPSNAP family protein [Akkermansiaceae bacterium]MDB4310496.1 NIPSNAP family protein [Akkermansiaceae bacterium]MDB4319351.1 NIPSNAP family protein [bacterium]
MKRVLFTIKNIRRALLIAVATGVAFLSSAAAEPDARWMQSYDAGYADANGAWAGGSEMMHLAAHKGKLFASNGYWVDARWVIPPERQRQSAQVLRLDAPGAQWQVDLDMGKQNDGLGLEYMKGNILKSITFTRDANGEPLAKPETLLVMAAGANFERGGAVSAWVHDDVSGEWTHTLVRHGSSAGGVRWVPRDMEVYRDKVTGVERIFMSLGNPGIISGVYDAAAPGRIRWGRNLEHPFLTDGSFRTRPLGITQANGSLFFSEGDSIYQRIDGERPRYREIFELFEDTDTDVGGIRGLTRVPNPNGTGDSLLFIWAPGERSASEVKRLDPDGKGGYSLQDEARIIDLMSDYLGAEVTYTLGAHNMMYPFTDPATGETAHIIGFQGNIRGSKNHLRWQGSALYAGALYAVRRADRSYRVLEVNNRYKVGKHLLVSPRTFCKSPFGDGEIYVAGHDSSFKISDNMAWIFRAPETVVLGSKVARDAAPPKVEPKPDQRLLEGPVYELRIYSANEDRLEHLKKRFREHTDRIFKKHGLEAIGYWVPTEGPAKKRRRFIYILKHRSRYAAYENWIKFNNDREWAAVLDQPQFQGLLAEKPTSLFMNETEYSTRVRNAIDKPGGVFELRTYVTKPDKLTALNQRFKKHTAQIFNRHGMNNIGYWAAFDTPDSANTLIYLIHHANRKQADANWKAFTADPEWQKARRESESNGKILARPPKRIFLRAMNFSPLR